MGSLFKEFWQQLRWLLGVLFWGCFLPSSWRVAACRCVPKAAKREQKTQQCVLLLMVRILHDQIHTILPELVSFWYLKSSRISIINSTITFAEKPELIYITPLCIALSWRAYCRGLRNGPYSYHCYGVRYFKYASNDICNYLVLCVRQRK